jgi:hypothetical protein
MRLSREQVLLSEVLVVEVLLKHVADHIDECCYENSDIDDQLDLLRHHCQSLQLMMLSELES